jgi:hypothetical protein
MKSTTYGILLILSASGLALAQDAPPAGSMPTTGWRRVGDPPPNQPGYAYSQNPAPPADPNYAQRQPPPAPQNEPPNYSVPAQLTIRPGTFITVRVNQWLSSDRNQAGDAFAATLVRPVVVDGVVVAEPGQTIGGRVVEAKKAGHVEGVARLAVQLTDLTLVDGQQLPIQTQLMSRVGPTSVGRDVGAIAGTTAIGAAAGAAADWGRGAAIGAGAGAAVGIIGVLLTRGHASVIYPESVLTFRVEAPITIATDRAPQAFRYVEPNEYERPSDMQTRRPPPPARGPYAYDYAPAPPPYYYGGPAYHPYYPYYGGFSLWLGPRYYHGGGYFYGGRGYRGRR